MHAGTGAAIMAGVQNGHDDIQGDDKDGHPVDRLVYPEASRLFARLSRFSYRTRVALVTLYGVGYATFLVLVGHFFSWSVVIVSVLLALGNAWLERRLNTVVTAETITVQGVFHAWTLPVSDVKEVIERNLAGNPVFAVTNQGRRRKLQRVKLENLQEISDLTGLPTRNWTQTH